MQLIVDANIVRSATDKEASSLDGFVSRKILDHFLITRNVTYVSEELHAEWLKHKRGYGTRWLALMYARNKIKNFCLKDNTFKQHILENINPSHNHYKNLLKDAHLIDLALESKSYNVSKDNNFKRMINKNFDCVSFPLLKDIVWLDPMKPENNHIEILAILKAEKVIAAKHYIAYGI